MISSIPAKCTGCGADLNFPPGQTSVVCEYCSSRVLLSDVVKSEVGSGGAAVIGAEIEKKKLAIQLATRDLGELEAQESMVSARIYAMENPGGMRRKGGGSVAIMILFLMMAMMVGIQMPLFYMLGIYGVYGFTKDGCLITGIVLIVIGIGGAIGTKMATDSYARSQREQSMRTPEYQRLLWERQQLQGRVQAAQMELQRLEQMLKALL